MFSQYVWRGMLPTNGPVLQNSVTALWRGAHLNMWTNLDLDAANGRRGKFNEVDFEAGYERSLAKAGISAGVIRYRFPNTPAAPITEVYADATRSLSNHTILPQPECARRPSPAGRDVLWDVAAKGRKVSPIWSTYSSTSNRYA